MADWSFFHKNKNITDRWPKTEDGEPVAPAFLMHLMGDQLDIEIQINLLEAYGIPVLTSYPGGGQLGKVILGTSGTGIDTFVPETMLEDAKNLLSADVVEDAEE